MQCYKEQWPVKRPFKGTNCAKIRMVSVSFSHSLSYISAKNIPKEICQYPGSPLLKWQDIAWKSAHIVHMAHVNSFIKRFILRPHPNAVNYSLDMLRLANDDGKPSYIWYSRVARLFLKYCKCTNVKSLSHNSLKASHIRLHVSAYSQDYQLK